MNLKYALTMLTRLVARKPSEMHKLEQALAGQLDKRGADAIRVAEETGEGVVGKALAGAIGQGSVLDAIALAHSIPEKSPSLAEARKAAQKAAGVFSMQKPSTLLWEKGLHNAAIEDATRRVDHYRKSFVRGIDADQMGVGLALELTRLAGYLGQSGNVGDAVKSFREAICICQLFLEEHSDDSLCEHYKNVLGMTLIAYSTFEMTMDHFNVSEVLATEAVAIIEPMEPPYAADKGPIPKGAPPLYSVMRENQIVSSVEMRACSYINLGLSRMRLGKFLSALQPCQKAVADMRFVCEKRSGHQDKLAESCAMLAYTYRDLGDLEAASELEREANQLRHGSAKE